MGGAGFGGGGRGFVFDGGDGGGGDIVDRCGSAHCVGGGGAGGGVDCGDAGGGRKSGMWGRLVEGEMIILVGLILAGLVLWRGLRVEAAAEMPRRLSTAEFRQQLSATDRMLGDDGAWSGSHFARVVHADGGISVWRYMGMERLDLLWAAGVFMECQVVTETPSGEILLNGKRAGAGNELHAMGFVRRLPRGGNATGPLSPLGFLATVQQADIGLLKQEVVTDERGRNTVYFSEATSGEDVMSAGNSEMFEGMRNGEAGARWGFVSMMLAMFFMVAAMPGFLGRYCGMKDERTARGALLVGTAGVALICGMTLFLGLGAMTSGSLDPTNSNVGLLMLARSFGVGVFAVVWVALAAATMWMGLRVAKEVRHAMGDWSVDGGKAVLWGGLSVLVAAGLGELFRGVNVAVALGWAIGVAVSGHLAAVVMSLYWKGATGAGVAASIIVGFGVSMGWIVLAWAGVTGFDQPAVVGVPAAFVALIVVSAMTSGRGRTT